MIFLISSKESFFSFYKTLRICYPYLHNLSFSYIPPVVIFIFIFNFIIICFFTFKSKHYLLGDVFVSPFHVYPPGVLEGHVFKKQIIIIVVDIYCQTTYLSFIFIVSDMSYQTTLRINIIYFSQ